MSLREWLIADIPAIFTGDDRQVLVDWLTNLKFGSIDYSKMKGLSDLDHACAIFMEEGHAEVGFAAMKRCQEANINPLDFEKAAIRSAFDNVWAVVKRQNPEIREAISLELGEFALIEAFVLTEQR